MTTIDELLSDIIAAAPALEFVRRQHLADHDELLPHVLFGDVTRWVVANGPQARLLAILEHHLAAGNEDVRNVIAVSFLENLERGDPAHDRVRGALGPGLRAVLDSMEAWSPQADVDLYAHDAGPGAAIRRTIRLLCNGDDTRRVEIFRRPSGTYGFLELRWDNTDSSWIPAGRFVESFTESPERAESEAKSRVQWMAEGEAKDV